MGGQFSTPRVKHHKSPVERSITRYTPALDSEERFEGDQSADKYDYLLIFHNDRKNDGETKETITWNEVRSIWFRAVPGDDKRKEKAIRHLQEEWIAVFDFSPQSHSKISLNKFHLLARRVIVNELAHNSGFQIKTCYSKDKSKFFCRIRAPVKLLEKQAEIDGYRLQFRHEVDPGPDFWLDTEISEDARILEKKDANEILEKLYESHKITPNDLAVFAEETTPYQWSRRVHVLERVADRIPFTNAFPAYSPFHRHAKFRHLFNTYPSVRGRTLFRSKDRLILTSSILNSFFDMGVLKDREVILGCMALHDANRGEKLTSDGLKKRWVTYWKEEPHKIGAPKVSDAEATEDLEVPWWKRPFSQPLSDIRDYYGEKIAIYFAWLGFYTYSLIFPSLVGLANQIYILYVGGDDSSYHINVYQVITIFVICMWTVYYKEKWDGEEKLISVKWGTQGYIEAEKDRAEFRGDEETPRKRSIVTNRMETWSDPKIRQQHQFISFLIICLFILFLLGAVELIYFLQHYLVNEKGFWWGSEICGLVSSVQIQVLSYIYADVAKNLNDWENYQTDSAYENNLVFKTFLFQMFNNYAALVYTAFIQGPVYGCSGRCIDSLRSLLIKILCIQTLMNIQEIGSPTAKKMYNEWKLSRKRQELATSGEESTKILESTVMSIDEEKQVEETIEAYEEEYNLEEYEGTFDDYAEIVLQYGYVTMFVAALPCVPLIALFQNLLEIRVDAYKMTTLERRPEPSLAENVGMWSSLMNAMGIMAIIMNTAIICFTTSHLHNYSVKEKWLIFLIAEQVLMVCKVFFHIIIPDEPDYLDDIRQRQKFVIQKHIHGFATDSINGAVDSKKQIHGYIDPDNLDLVETGTLSLKVLQVVKNLRHQLRSVQQQLKHIKSQLKAAYETERFNDRTKIGETLDGLPLGLVKVNLMWIDGFSEPPHEISISVSLNPTGSESVGPEPVLSRAGVRGKDEGTINFDEIVSLIPVRTHEAKICLQVLSSTTENPILGFAFLPLHELTDQSNHEKTLNLSRSYVDGSIKPIKASIKAKFQFMYSKIKPLRKKVSELETEKLKIERKLTKLQLGESIESAEDDSCSSESEI